MSDNKTDILAWLCEVIHRRLHGTVDEETNDALHIVSSFTVIQMTAVCYGIVMYSDDIHGEAVAPWIGYKCQHLIFLLVRDY